MVRIMLLFNPISFFFLLIKINWADGNSGETRLCGAMYGCENMKKIGK